MPLLVLMLAAMMIVPAVSLAGVSTVDLDGAQTLAAAAQTSAAVVTVTGGRLPTTATPWYNVLVAGLVLTLLGTVGFWATAREMHD